MTAPDHEQAERIARRYEHDEDAWESTLLSRAYLDLAAQLAEAQENLQNALEAFNEVGATADRLEAQLAERERALEMLTTGWAMELVERVEASHNELQRLGLIERESGEASRKILGSMATDAVYFAGLIRDLLAATHSDSEERGQ